MVDKNSDLALLQITDERLNEEYNVPYAISNEVVMVGAEVYSLGYPLFMNGMGKEIKYTNGSISSKTGYKDNVNTYQTNVAVQPGNSGSPLFNNQGEVVGCINAVIRKADNVSYAVKSSAIKNLVLSYNQDPHLPSTSSLKNLPLEEQIKRASDFIGVIKVKD